VVLHYDKRAATNGIVGWSLVSGPWQSAPIVWGARGTYARDKGTQPRERPGFVIPLERLAARKKLICRERATDSPAVTRARLRRRAV
jgi:hypothetical protein